MPIPKARAAAALLAIALASCETPPELPPPPPPDDECELDLNLDLASAAPLVFEAGTASGTGVLCPAFDQDFFAFDIATAGTIGIFTITMPTALSRVNPAYRIVKENGTPEGEPTPFSADDAQKSQGEATNFTGLHRFDEPGRYYVLVFDVTFVEQAFDIENAFTLTVTLATDPDTNEPNNAPEAATAATSGTALTAQIATSGDEDWYRVAVPAGAKILDIIVAAAADVGVEHEVVLFAADGTTQIAAVVASADGSVEGQSSARLRHRVVGGADSLIVVRDRSGDKASLDAGQGYTMTATIVDNPDQNEGAATNDTADLATVVQSGAQVQAALASFADQDVYRITPPANVSRTNPSVLIIGVDVDGVDPRDFTSQVQVFQVNPEAAANQQQCRATCAICDQDVCKDVRLQRFIRGGGGYQTAVALRDARDVIVFINEFGDDAFQETGGYTIRFEIVDDPDDGEGDDFLIPNLEFAGFENDGDLAQQFDRSVERARVLTTTYPPVCTGTNDPAGCLPLIDVPSPIAGVPEEFTRAVDCSAAGAAPQTVTATGRLTYEGDRDYFRIDLPGEGYWALDFDYRLQGAATTPIELTLFVHAGDRLIANTLTATQTQARCLDTVDCPDGSICVDGACWADGLENATFSSRSFPTGDECAFVSVVDRGRRPLYLEVTDNGINDFDVDVTYTFTLRVRCGCPSACNRGAGNCQGVAAPAP